MISADRLASSIRSGEVGAVETVTKALERIDASTLNAFTLVDHEGALAAARRVDDLIAAGEEPGPLAGVPFAVKDLFDQAGLVNTAGSSFYRAVPQRSATAVRRLERAGAVAVGRTGLHEFAFGFSSENHWFGPVRNPWNPDTSPGGSSGGSAAAVAAGLTPVALGTDTGGSVRVPAALCGLVGLKVTHGRIPITGVFPLAPSLDTVGPITASVVDAALLYETMAGPDDEDAWSTLHPVEPARGPMPLQGLRVGVPEAWIEAGPVSAGVAAGFEWFQDFLARHGAVITPVDLPGFIDTDQLVASAYGEVAAVHRRFRKDGNRYGPEVERRMAHADRITLDEYVASLAWRAGIRRSARKAFERVDFLVTPATGVTVKPIGESMVPTDKGDVHYRSALSWFSAPVNHAGLPALAVPLALDGAPPPAAQIIGAWSHERRLLEFGLALEAERAIEPRLPQNAD